MMMRVGGTQQRLLSAPPPPFPPSVGMHRKYRPTRTYFTSDLTWRGFGRRALGLELNQRFIERVLTSVQNFPTVPACGPPLRR